MKKEDLLKLLPTLPKTQEHDYFFYYAQVTLKKTGSDRVLNSVIFCEENAYLKHWESLPEEHLISLDQIENLGFPPYCLSSEIAEELYNKVPFINDSYTFFLRLKNGQVMRCQTDFILSFLEIPEGYSIFDVDSVDWNLTTSTGLANKADLYAKTPLYYWCFY